MQLPLSQGLMTQGQQTERRGQDSNLRTSFPVTDLANRRFRPLSHLSNNACGNPLSAVSTRFDPNFGHLTERCIPYPPLDADRMMVCADALLRSIDRHA